MSKLLAAAVAVCLIAAFSSAPQPAEARLVQSDGLRTRRNPRHCHQEG